jgi:O-glycosyl hydrolase
MSDGILSFGKLGAIFLVAIGSVVCGCSKNAQQEIDPDKIKNKIVIDINQGKQIIKNFGASDAWACQYIGLWPDEKRNQVTDWLFSLQEDADGRPKGIGLSLWRFNIGAGSTAQSNISDEWRRTEGFLQNDLSYDWTKQSGQRWFMHSAKQKGVEQFLGFANSPPVQLTKNGKAYSENGEEANISPANYLAFSKFLVDVSKQFIKEGIAFNYLSPFNEPQWDWTGNGQEGTPFKNEEIFAVTKILDSLLTTQGLNIQLQIAEAGKLNYLYEKADKPTRGEQIKEFFTSQSPLYMGDFQHVDKVISGHSYFTSAPVEELISTRKKLSQALGGASIPLEFWQSEYCILGGQEEIQAEGKETGIDPALYVSRIIHHDLTVANASAWHWWLAVSVYDYKDGLIYADKNKTNGEVEDTKLLWALGNFSRFIRPGYQRVNVSSENMNVNNANGTMVSSFVDQMRKKLITVVVNYSNVESSFSLAVDGGKIESWKPYLTGPGEGEELKPLPQLAGTDRIIVPRRSIITLVGELQ